MKANEICDDTGEQKEFYAEILERIIKNPRFYLENLGYLEVFRFDFIHYNYKRKKPL